MAKRKPIKDPAALPPGKHGFGGGLWLTVAPSGARTWSYRFRLITDRTMGLGGFPVVTLEAAREAALDARRLVRAGTDPIEARKAAVEARKAAVKKANGGTLFAAVAEEHIAASRGGWSSPTAERAWRASLAQHAGSLAGLDVADITVADVAAALKPIWTRQRPTAERVRARIEATLDRAIALDLRKAANPAALRVIKQVLPKTSRRKVEHHAALPYAELPAFMGELSKIEGVTAAALAFCVRTAARTGEVLGARWKEIDMAREIWTVPAHRMKAGAEHTVPLTGAVVGILRSLPRGSDDDHVFTRGRERLGVHAMRRLAQEIAPGVAVHGFRSTFRDWAGDTHDAPREIIEAALAHTVGSAAERAYRRGSALEKRRRLMEDWSEFCNGGADASVTVARAA